MLSPPEEVGKEVRAVEKGIEELGLERKDEAEVGEVEKGIEELGLEGKVENTNLDESISKEEAEKLKQDPATERLKEAVMTVTDRIDRWFVECIEDMEKKLSRRL